MYVLSTILIIDVIINILSVASTSFPLPISAIPFAFITFVFVHEFAHKVHTDGEYGEYGAENGYHLPLIMRFLCDKRSVDSLSVLILFEKYQKMV